MKNQIIALTDDNFDEQLAKSPLLVVDFWADWCGPCKRVSPIIDELAEEFSGRAVIGKLNVDESTEIAQRYGVMSIPSVLIFKNGEQVDKQVGAVPIGAYRALISSQL